MSFLMSLTTGVLLSLIFVPVLTALFILLFVVIMLKRSKPESVVFMMYELKLTLDALSADRLTVKQLKALDMRLSKLQMLADQASFEDSYDVSLAVTAFDEARKISAALYGAEREDCAPYLVMIRDKLEPAAQYLVSVTGIPLNEAGANFKLFSVKAKRSRAEKYLDELKK